MQLNLEREQIELLADICEQWMEGCQDSMDDVTVDKGHPTPEEMLKAVDDMQDLFDAARTIRIKLKRALDV